MYVDWLDFPQIWEVKLRKYQVVEISIEIGFQNNQNNQNSSGNVIDCLSKQHAFHELKCSNIINHHLLGSFQDRLRHELQLHNIT